MLSLPNILRDIRRRKIIRTYLIELRQLLAEQYGAAEYYSPQQVAETVQMEDLPQEEMRAACAIYCMPEEYAAFVGDGYWSVRVEIGELFFGGNASFTAQDAASLVKTRREMVFLGDVGSEWAGGDSGGHDCGGHGGGH